jgi:predicted PurR-regulated permease PerM
MIILILSGKYFGGWGLILSIPAAGAVKVTYGYVIKNLY